MSPTKKTIATKLFKAVFLFYVLIAALVVGAVTAKEYIDSRDDVIHELEIYEKTFSAPLADALWALDMRELQSIILGMEEIPEIVGVKIMDHNAQKVFTTTGMVIDEAGGAEPPLELYEHEFPVDFHHETGAERVGIATIYSSQAVVFERIKFRIFMVVSSVLIMIVALWVILLYVSRVMLSKPLARLTAYTEEIGRAHV